MISKNVKPVNNFSSSKSISVSQYSTPSSFFLICWIFFQLLQNFFVSALLGSSLKVLSVETMIELGSKKEFPQKEFLINGKKCLKTPILHFFECETVFATKPDVIQFICKVCTKDCTTHFSAVT